jgi:hypothetical protein
MRESPERCKIGRRIEAAGVEIRERLNLAGQLQGLRLGRLRRNPAAEILDRVDQIDIGPTARSAGSVLAPRYLRRKRANSCKVSTMRRGSSRESVAMGSPGRSGAFKRRFSHCSKTESKAAAAWTASRMRAPGSMSASTA